MMTKKQALAGAGALAVLALAACGVGRAVGETRRGLRTVRGDLERRVLLTGELLALDATEIQVPRTSMWNVRISWMIEDGAEVEAGDRILEFDNTPFVGSLDNDRTEVDRIERALELERANAEVSVIDAELRVDRARIALEQARLEADVPKRLIGAKKAEDARIALRKAEVEFDKATDALDVVRRTTETDLRLRKVELERARRKVELAESAIAQLVVRAPESGIVTVADHPWEGRKFEVGDNPWVGLTVLRIPRLERIAVRAWLFDVDDGLVTPGMQVLCRLDMYPDRVFSGVVRDVTPIANETGPFSLRRVFEMTINLEHPDTSRMRPGMSVRVDVPLPPVEDVVLAPREALIVTNEGVVVRPAEGPLQEVRTGPCSARWCVIEEGLDEDVVVEAALGERR